MRLREREHQFRAKIRRDLTEAETAVYHRHGAPAVADDRLRGREEDAAQDLVYIASDTQDPVRIVPDIVTIGKGFGNGFPVTCVAVREPFKESFESISASSSYGGNPMACAAALASTEVIEEEGLLAHAEKLGEIALRRMKRMQEEHKIIGDVRAKGCLMGIELVKDRTTKEPFDKAGTLVYQKAFRKGLAWIPAGHILRMSPPIVMDEAALLKGLDLIDEAIGETARELGY